MERLYSLCLYMSMETVVGASTEFARFYLCIFNYRAVVFRLTLVIRINNSNIIIIANDINTLLALTSVCTRKYCLGVYKCLRGQYDARGYYFGTVLKNSCFYSPDMLQTYKI